MRRIVTSPKLLLSITAIALALGGCASPADRAAMTPQNLTVSKHHPYSLRVQTSGGAATGAMDSSNVSDADLKAAIEDAIAQSKLFTTIVQGSNGDYELSVRLTSLSKPIFGATFTVDMETAWALTKASDGSVVLRKAVKSSGTATMGEAFAGVTRLRMAVEAATRNNIEQGIKTVAELNL
jgi:PBP1b-binding outer membrane lipoprotein LpoB